MLSTQNETHFADILWYYHSTVQSVNNCFVDLQ